jgi:hypothetical protein
MQSVTQTPIQIQGPDGNNISKFLEYQTPTRSLATFVLDGRVFANQ